MDPIFDPPVLEMNLGGYFMSLNDTPYFYNDGGKPQYLKSLPNGVSPLTPAPRDPTLAMGHEHVVPGILSTSNSQWGSETQLDFAPGAVPFEPLWATRDAAAAFGITLVEPGQAVQLECPNPNLAHFEYRYGVFAGHWSPYQNTGNTLLSVVCTDLEHHDFPHIFASIDPNFPLVTSVGRYWPKKNIIRLADLWVPQGCALYIPPMPFELGAECIDLHNNRNSALACWGQIEHNSLTTQTLLQPNDTYFYWYWNALATTHTKPAFIQP